MKKKLYALSGVFLIVLVISGLWADVRATKATIITDESQTYPAETSRGAEMPMKQMVGESSLIVIGECTETSSQWVEGRRLYTLATVSVTESLKGDPAKEVK